MLTTPNPVQVETAPVLLVEDNADMRAGIAEVLQDAGYLVIEAGNGREALHALEQLAADRKRPCVILLDLMMPVMDGWAFMEQLRWHSHWAIIPIVVTSAVPPELRRDNYLGATAYLTKPFDLDELLRLIASACEPGAE